MVACRIVVVALVLLTFGMLALSSDEPPYVSVTFTATGEVEHHLPEETRFGECESSYS